MKKSSNTEKQIPLHYAARFSSSDVIRYFINECGADKEAKDYLKRTPLYIAAEFGIYKFYFNKVVHIYLTMS